MKEEDYDLSHAFYMMLKNKSDTINNNFLCRFSFKKVQNVMNNSSILS